MRILTLIIACFLIGCSALTKEQSVVSIRPEIVLGAVEQFRSNPVAEDAMEHLSVVASFANNSDDVYVLIDKSFFPDEFFNLKGIPKQRLLGAYVAGNIESQLISEDKENRPLSGVQLMLQTYKAMRNIDVLDELSGFEEFITQDQQGKLSF